MSQKQKLIAAGAVLAVGLGMALLFRRGEPEVALAPVAAQPPSVSSPGNAAPLPVASTNALAGQFSPLAPLPATSAGFTGVDVPLASTTPLGSLPPAGPAFGSAPTGATGAAGLSVAQPPLDAAAAPVAPQLGLSAGRPVYATIDAAAGSAPEDDATSKYRTYVVHEGDSLERLAERYLSDGGRSLELFDLNRDVLDNPHLLPIGAELRIPIGPSDSGD